MTEDEEKAKAAKRAAATKLWRLRADRRRDADGIKIATLIRMHRPR